jgi:hypothetical protein
MNDYLDILEDVLRIATFQPRLREKRRPHQASRSRTIGMTFVP